MGKKKNPLPLNLGNAQAAAGRDNGPEAHLGGHREDVRTTVGPSWPSCLEEIHQQIVYFCKEPGAVRLGALCTVCPWSWEVPPVLSQAPALGLGREQPQAASGGIVGA